MGNPSHGMAAMAPSMAPNDVVIIGAESQVKKIKSVRVDVDIASVNSEVSKILPVRVLDESGKDIQNITIEPGNVEVSIPIENTKLVSLEMDLLGQPAEGYLLYNTSIKPEEILITGKQQALEGINLIKTEKIDITEGTADISKEVKLEIPAGIEIVNANEKVNIFINIEKIKTSEIAVENLEYVNLPEGLEFDSIQSNIKGTLRGIESRFQDALTSVRFYVDLANAVEGDNSLNVLWEAPEEIEILDIAPKQVIVVLKKKSVE
jgi:YbbR domain-containing protein